MSLMAAAILSPAPAARIPNPNPPDYQAAGNGAGAGLPRSTVRSIPTALRRSAIRSMYSPGGIGSSRADWQASCAIIASKVDFFPGGSNKPATGDANGNGEGTGSGESSSNNNNNHHLSSTTISSVNGVKTANGGGGGGGSGSLDLVPISILPRPLSISDLSPAPLHGAQLRVAYQGVPGAYSEAAAGKAYPGCEAIPCDQFEVAFQAVELWIADRAVLPVENSLGGSIHRNYDLLLRHRLHIVGEVQLPVHHCLLTLPGVRKEYLTRVISHPQALAQCELTLTQRLGLNVAREAFDDTAGAAEYVANNRLRDTAAIASARAADLYGLQILADGIQDDSSNVTRFVMLAREPIIPRTDRPFKTSIVFAHDREGTSVLFKVLSAFAFRDISLTKIESRPHRHRPIRMVDDANVGTAKHFEYMFYVDFEASMADVRAQNALSEIQEFTSFLRILGSYPMDMTPWTTDPSSPPPPSPSAAVPPSPSAAVPPSPPSPPPVCG